MSQKSWDTMEGSAAHEECALIERVRVLEDAVRDAKEAIDSGEHRRASEVLERGLGAGCTVSKTRAEIEALKANWLGDPCWDIEETEGFEAHRSELYTFRLEQENNNMSARLDVRDRALRALKSLLESV